MTPSLLLVDRWNLFLSWVPCLLCFQNSRFLFKLPGLLPRVHGFVTQRNCLSINRKWLSEMAYVLICFQVTKSNCTGGISFCPHCGLLQERFATKPVVTGAFCWSVFWFENGDSNIKPKQSCIHGCVLNGLLISLYLQTSLQTQEETHNKVCMVLLQCQLRNPVCDVKQREGAHFMCTSLINLIWSIEQRLLYQMGTVKRAFYCWNLAIVVNDWLGRWWVVVNFCVTPGRFTSVI